MYRRMLHVVPTCISELVNNKEASDNPHISCKVRAVTGPELYYVVDLRKVFRAGN